MFPDLVRRRFTGLIRHRYAEGGKAEGFQIRHIKQELILE